MVELFIQSLLIGYSGAVMPGSLLTYTLDKSIKSGAKAGLLISAGHALLELVLVILILFGFGRYLDTTTAQLIIGILGGIILIFLGLGMLKDVCTGKINIHFEDKPQSKYGSILAGGAIISAANPYFTVWWAVIGLGLIMSAYNAFGFLGVVLFYAGHITADISWYVFVSVLVSKTRRFINLRVYKIIIVILGIILTGFGISFLISSLSLL